MPLHIVEKDITKFRCDAIVNAANNSLLGGGGVDDAIHSAAGEELLAECKTLGGCNTGDAKITKGYNLPCKFIIHTVGPIWRGGGYDEENLLKSCYEKSLALAKEYGLEKIAFPLISAGVYGYPKNKALSVAVQTISEFLQDNDMTVYITILNKSSFQIDDELFAKIDCFLYTLKRTEEYLQNIHSAPEILPHEEKAILLFDDEEAPLCSYCDEAISAPLIERLEDLFKCMDDSFTITLLKLIDKKGMTDVECYKKANVSKQTWYKIMNNKNYNPSKNTVLCFAIALKLSLEETKFLLSTVGYAFSNSNKFDLIIQYFLTNGEYDIFKINQVLFAFDQVCLGV